jgi:hypothetical protein
MKFSSWQYIAALIPITVEGGGPAGSGPLTAHDRHSQTEDFPVGRPALNDANEPATPSWQSSHRPVGVYRPSALVLISQLGLPEMDGSPRELPWRSLYIDPRGARC